MSSNTLQLAMDLIRRESVTPEDNGCQKMLADRLSILGFNCHHLSFGDVDNLWAVYGESGPLFCFAGHTDVVPPGDPQNWEFPPFEPQIINGMLRGRGAADMKGSIAAMVTAVERFLHEHPEPGFRIAWLITSDEEGDAVNGTVKVIDWLEQQETKIDWCLVGEPSSTELVGDIIKNGRRGSLGARLKVKGIQGHVAYPHLADNPVHRTAPALADLASREWDQGNASFPPTSFQVSNLSAGTGATNVIPGEMEVVFNFRFSTEQTPEALKEATESVFAKYGLDYAIEWNLSGQPFLTESGSMVEAAKSAVSEVTGRTTTLSTSGGTSDGRFIAPTGAQVIELGPVNATIHKVDEQILASDLDELSLIYERILVELKNQAS
jgi:succinyl-diaminopimelate desuccinylase